MTENFWKSEILRWEASRYHGKFSKFLYSSLYHRKGFIGFLLNQLPEGSSIVELGCGSGELFRLLDPAKNFHYLGIDISEVAIEKAQVSFRSYPNAKWQATAVDEVQNLKGTICVSAGLLDWIDDGQIHSILENNEFTFHVHSFSEDQRSFTVAAHAIFKKLIRWSKKIDYSPRKFSRQKIQDVLTPVAPITIVEHKELSFGRVLHNFDNSVDDDFNSYLVNERFRNKGLNQSIFEKFIKTREQEIVFNLIQDIRQKKVLEVGSGTGAYTARLLAEKPQLLSAIDPAIDTTQFIQKVSSQNFFSFYKTKLESFQSTSKYDLILALGITEFIENHITLLSKIKDSLSEKGTVIIMAPTRAGLFRFLYSTFYAAIGLKLNFLDMNNIARCFDRKYKISVLPCGPLNQIIVIQNV